jgi:Protein of unknown function (DUF4446)
MSTVLSTLTEHSGIVFTILSLLIVILTILVVRNTLLLRSTLTKFRYLLSTDSTADLESLLLQHIEKREQLAHEVAEIESRLTTTERKLQKSKRHVGLVRYDAFPEIGGQQSFALAIYDDNGDGAVVSSIIGRADCRVYGKPILNGNAERSLTNEERQAILDAVSTAPRSFLSH